MHFPLPIVVIATTSIEPPPAGTTLPRLALQDPAGWNVGMASLTNNVPEQPRLARAVTAVIPKDGSMTFMRSNTYGISSPTGTYPSWMNTGTSYWTNWFRRPADEDFAAGRFLIIEPLAGYQNNWPVDPNAPFGRTSNKARVADSANAWRSIIRWRHRVLLSTDVGPTSASITAADLAAVRNTNSRVLGLVGPNEIDHGNNWRYYYLNYTAQPDEITTTAPIGNVTRADTIFASSLSVLFLRIVDHMRHTYEAVNDPLGSGGAGRTNVACIMPALIKSSIAPGTSDFTVYDLFNYEDTSANVGYKRGDFLQWIDAMQIHIHVNHFQFPNPWAADPLADNVRNTINPWHIWRAKLDNEAWRISQGLDPLRRPLVDGERGIPHQGDGIPLDWRPAQFQLRRLKYGQMIAGAIAYGITMYLTYSHTMSGNYGFNLLWHPSVVTIDGYSIDTTARGSGYAAGSTYQLNQGSSHRATFRVVSVDGSGGVTSLRINHTGFFTTTPPARVALVAPSGGSACFLNLTYKDYGDFFPVGDLGERDVDYLHAACNKHLQDVSRLPKLDERTFEIPIYAKSWKNYWRDWVVWFYQSQDPIDDVPTATLVTNRGHMANTSQSSGNNRNVVYRTTYWTSKQGGITAAQLVYANGYLDASGEHNGLATIYVTCAVEYNGVTKPVTFNGVREVTIAPGEVVKSDIISLAVPADTQLYVRSNARTANTGDKYPLGYTTRTDWGEGWSLSSPLAQVDGVGLLSGNGSNAMFGPIAVLGSTSVSNPPRFVIIGSSSAFGSNETFATLPAPGDRGYLSRLVSNNYGQCVLACGSQTIAQFNTANAIRMAAIAALGPSHIINQMGANDISGGATAATVQSRLQTMWATLASTGAKIIQVTYSPTSTSTDGWTTVENQTPTNATVRHAVNNYIRTLPSPISAVLDVQRVTESSTDSGRWRVDGGAWSNDGTHSIRHGDIAAALNLEAVL